jgi:hypothetical protein
MQIQPLVDATTPKHKRARKRRRKYRKCRKATGHYPWCWTTRASIAHIVRWGQRKLRELRKSKKALQIGHRKASRCDLRNLAGIAESPLRPTRMPPAQRAERAQTFINPLRSATICRIRGAATRYARALAFSWASTPICRSTSRSAGRCASGSGRRGARGGPIGMPIISKQALVPET